MSVLYTTRATALAGRNGRAVSDDGLLDVNLTYPKALGGSGEATNPEQLFAAGYAACFSNAVLHVAKEANLPLEYVPTTAEVGIGPNPNGGFALTVSLEVTLDLEQEQAVTLVNAAHQVCPYSNAVRGNIDVALTVNGQSL